jgi:glycosyltransferase involved in cell wall biosynthesis
MTKAQPLVCICIPTYNAEKTIAEMLSSVLRQTYPNLKIVVIDNASTDSTLNIVRSFNDPRLSIHCNKENIGAVGNFDRCIELSDGDYTEMFHADEVYEPDMVKEQVEALDHFPNAGAVFTEAELIDGQGTSFGETRVAQFVGRNRGEVISLNFKELFPAVLRNGNFLLCSGALVRTSIYKNEIKSFDAQRFKSSCDLDVWLRILERHEIAFVLNKLMRTRSSETQASFTELKRNTNRADMFLVLDFYLQKYLNKSILDEWDIRVYEGMQRMDTTRRAMNLYLLGRYKEASALLNEMSKSGLFRFLTHSKRGFLTFALASYLRVTMFLHIQGLGVRLLQSVVKKTKR